VFIEEKMKSIYEILYAYISAISIAWIPIITQYKESQLFHYVQVHNKLCSVFITFLKNINASLILYSVLESAFAEGLLDLDPDPFTVKMAKNNKPDPILFIIACVTTDICSR